MLNFPGTPGKPPQEIELVDSGELYLLVKMLNFPGTPGKRWKRNGGRDS
jgi:hypothetical protein